MTNNNPNPIFPLEIVVDETGKVTVVTKNGKKVYYILTPPGVQTTTPVDLFMNAGKTYTLYLDDTFSLAGTMKECVTAINVFFTAKLEAITPT